MNRREFLRVTLMGLLAAAFAAVAFLPNPAFVTRWRIRRHLGQYEISDEDLDRFLREFEKHYGTPAPGNHEFQKILVMSTDAFELDESQRKLQFVKLYHPYANPCYNPLARL